MKFRRLGLCITGLLLAITVGSGAWAKEETNKSRYTVKDKEYYLSEDVLAFVRPGLEIEIVDVTIPADLTPEVTYTLADPAGLPLDIDGVTTPGSVFMEYSLTFIPQGEMQPVILAGALYDQGGTVTAMGNGTYMYKFGTVLGDNYDPDATHTLGLHGVRNLEEFGLGKYVAEPTLAFVPSGASEPMPREIVTTETCNRCHGRLGMHEPFNGPFEEIPLCKQCHNPTIPFGGDPDFLRFDTLIHHVHAEAAEYPAPLSDCEVCHTGGTPTADFPLVATPAKARSCEGKGKGSTTLTWDTDVAGAELRLDAPDGKLVAKGSSGEVETGNWITDGREFFLVDGATGETIQGLTMNTTVLGCVGEAPGSPRGVAGVTHTAWLTNPNGLTCGACHSNVNFETGEGHSELNLAVDPNDSAACANCHKPDTGEFDRSIRGAHLVEWASDQLPGILVGIEEVQNTAPGDFPRVVFTISDKFGPIDPNSLQRLRFSLSGPNTDFSFYAQEEAVGSAVQQTGTTWVYDFATAIPDDAEGSFTIGVEGRKPIVLNEGLPTEFETEDQMQNFVKAFAVTDATAEPRRMVVDDALCENCHVNLSLHGDNRKEAQYCVTCHMPGATDEEVRPEGEPGQSIAMSYMIHKIHAGAELQNGYVVLGYRGSVNDFSHVEYVGDLANCDGCHVDNSYTLPLAEGLLPVETNYDLLAEQEATTAACLACHDGDDAFAHADANTSATLGESCTTCHGVGKAYAVEKVHFAQ